MRLESKIINALIEQEMKEEVPPIGTPVQAIACEPPQHFSFRDLKKNARDIMLLGPANLTALLKEQGRKGTIEEAKFIDFYLCSSELCGKFKVIFAADEMYSERIESFITLGWNGNQVKIH